jgi:hypothetical protein
MIADHWARFCIEHQISYTTYVLWCSVKEDSRFLIPSYTTAVREPRSDHNANRCYADASLSSKLRLRAFKQVRHSSLPVFYFPQCARSSFSVPESLLVSNLMFPKIKLTDPPADCTGSG